MYLYILYTRDNGWFGKILRIRFDRYIHICRTAERNAFTTCTRRTAVQRCGCELRLRQKIVCVFIVFFFFNSFSPRSYDIWYYYTHRPVVVHASLYTRSSRVPTHNIMHIHSLPLKYIIIIIMIKLLVRVYRAAGHVSPPVLGRS